MGGYMKNHERKLSPSCTAAPPTATTPALSPRSPSFAADGFKRLGQTKICVPFIVKQMLFAYRSIRPRVATLHLSQVQKIFHAESGIFEDTGGKSSTNVAASVDGNGDRNFAHFIPECEMTAGLAVFNESLRFQEGIRSRAVVCGRRGVTTELQR